jgi:hypothetical protein
MTEQSQPRSTDSEAPREWPRTPEGYCSCPYCTAIREGRLDVPKSKSEWARRMGRPDTGRV